MAGKCNLTAETQRGRTATKRQNHGKKRVCGIGIENLAQIARFFEIALRRTQRRQTEEILFKLHEFRLLHCKERRGAKGDRGSSGRKPLKRFQEGNEGTGAQL